MQKTRLEAFSDGVIAIIITIMVLELKVPEGSDLQALLPVMPVFFSYVLSFIYIGIYWNNHHHLFLAVKQINGAVLWANLHLLFWLSLIPFVTAWAGIHHFAKIPTILYGVDLMFAGIAYFILSRTLIRQHGEDSVLARALGKDIKGQVSVVMYWVAILLANWSSSLAFSIYAMVAAIWFIPDRRIEKRFKR